MTSIRSWLAALISSLIVTAGVLGFAQTGQNKMMRKVASSETVTGYVRDSGCVHRFHEVVKPLPNGCVEACVRGGSPLVILTKNEEVYHPISSEMPDVDVRTKLLPFVGQLVKVKGEVYERGGSRSIALERIEEVKE